MHFNFATIYSKTEESRDGLNGYNFVSNFQHAKIQISACQLNVITRDGDLFKGDMKILEDSIFRIVYSVKFPNQYLLRLIKVKEPDWSRFPNYAVDIFSLASMNSTNGWSIGFFLSPNLPNIRYEPEEDDVRDFLVKHITSFNAFPSEFSLGITQKLLKLISRNPLMLYRVEELDSILIFMRDNIEFYSLEEQEIIKKIL